MQDVVARGHTMELAVKEMYHEYVTDKELTAFTSLNLDHFYEAK